MKLIALLVALVLSIGSYSQKLDESISEIANDLAQKVSKKGTGKLALTDFVNSEGKRDALTDYIREELELKLINSDLDLQVMDRKRIKLLLSEHHLQSEGLIDESTAKSAISFIKVDGWVIAEITSLDDQIKIKILVTDVSTSQIYAASTSGLITDVAITNLLYPPVKVCSECGGKGNVQVLTTCSVCEGKGSYNCTDCKGTGRRPGMTVGSYIKCEACNGVGKFDCNVCTGNGKIISYETCKKCNGKIQLPANTSSQNSAPKLEVCPDCTGNGKIKTQTTCIKCGGTGQAPFGPSSNWENKPCQSCSGKGKISSFIRCTKCNGTGNIGLQENMNNSEKIGGASKNKNCEEENTGDYCFQNNTELNLQINLTSSPIKVTTSETSYYTYTTPLYSNIQPGQKQCFFNVPAGAAKYSIQVIGNISSNSKEYYHADGSLYVELCRENTFIIKKL